MRTPSSPRLPRTDPRAPPFASDFRARFHDCASHGGHDMSPNEEPLRRVRAAYERARLLKGLRAALFVIPITAISFGCCGKISASIAIASVLALLVTFVVCRGGAMARAIVPGYAAGIVPLAVPLVACPACERMGVSA